MNAEPVQVTVTIEPITCGGCGVWFGLESSMLRSHRQDGGSFWCPKGCKISYHDSENARLKRILEVKERALQAEHEHNDRVRRERDHAQNSARTYRGHLTRVRKRVGNGVCPCCTRSFENLQRHMASRHPQSLDLTVRAVASARDANPTSAGHPTCSHPGLRWPRRGRRVASKRIVGVSLPARPLQTRGHGADGYRGATAVDSGDRRRARDSRKARTDAGVLPEVHAPGPGEIRVTARGGACRSVGVEKRT